MLLPNHRKPLWCYIQVFCLQSLPLVTPFASQGFPTKELLQSTDLFPFHLFFTSFFFFFLLLQNQSGFTEIRTLNCKITDVTYSPGRCDCYEYEYGYYIICINIICPLTRAKKERDRARVLVKRWTQSQSHDDFFPLPSSPSWSNKVSSSSSSRIIFAAAAAAVALFGVLSTVQAAFLWG